MQSEELFRQLTHANVRIKLLENENTNLNTEIARQKEFYESLAKEKEVD